ncbi:MAG: ester cyclase [Solirubrobacterales bacterium]
MASKAEKSRRLVDELWNGGKMETADELLAPDIVRYDPALPQPARGIAEYKQVVRTYRDAFPDLHLEILELVESDDHVASRWQATGTHRGDLMGLAATGRKSTVEGIQLSRWEDGVGVEEHQSWDQMGMLRQLGVLPERDSTQEKAMTALSNLRSKVSGALNR